MKISLILIDESQKQLDALTNLVEGSMHSLEIVGAYTSIPQNLHDRLLLKAKLVLISYHLFKEFKEKYIYVENKSVIHYGSTQRDVIEAFRLGVFDFLTLPINQKTFDQVLTRYKIRLAKEKLMSNYKTSIIELNKKLDTLLVKNKTISFLTEDGIEFIPLNSIIKCSQKENGCSITLENSSKPIRIIPRFVDISSQLEAFGFIQIDDLQSVNKLKIVHLKKSVLLLCNGDEITVGVKYISVLKKSLKAF